MMNRLIFTMVAFFILLLSPAPATASAGAGLAPEITGEALHVNSPPEVAEAPERIISLAPNVTEILFSLGVGSRIVAVTDFCDKPDEALSKPKIGGMTNPSLEAIARLKPDLVILSTDGNPKEFLRSLKRINVNSHVFDAQTLLELPREIIRLGERLGELERSEALAASIEDSYSASADAHGKADANSQKALFIIWPKPLIVAGPGTAIDDALHLLGLLNIAASTKTQWPKFSLEEIIRRSPDIIFITKMTDEAGNYKESSETRALLKKLKNVKAVREGRVIFLGDSLLRLGPRIPEGLREMSDSIDQDKIKRTDEESEGTNGG